ncbi:MAG TPA: PrsW family glutamic-type intramembrane protease [Thermoanaerobaculia bacterium]
MADTLRLLLSLFPVSVFLGSLIYLDSYQLLPLRSILRAILYGCLAALVAYAINRVLMQQLDRQFVMRYAAPFAEEVMKALPLFLLLRARRIGFLVDAAIVGFAIGAGFALVENLYYLAALDDAPWSLWIVRGFGTAVMHGGTTAILAVIAKSLSDRKQREDVAILLPGLAAAFAIHSFFNHFVIAPILSAALVLLILPPLLLLVFIESERYLRQWLGSGFDLGADLLAAMHSGEFKTTHVGEYLQSVREHFPGEVVADMLCYVRIHTELALRAKGILMLRETGFAVKMDEEIAAKLLELRYLRKSIGKTGQLAIAPILHSSSRDVWQLTLLESK